MIKMLVFDMDWTLTPSRQEIKPEMLELLKKLLKKYKVWIISGWDFVRFEIQILQFLWNDENILKNLYICPTQWWKMYVYKNNKWEKLYSLDFTKQEREHILKTLENAVEKLWLKPEKTYWELIEDRWTLICYAALWQEADPKLKLAYDPDFKKREKIRDFIKNDLEWFEFPISWSSSIDIIRKWQDKAFWVWKIIEFAWIKKNELIFVWDRVVAWWNDYSPLEKGYISKRVFTLEDTMEFIWDILKE